MKRSIENKIQKTEVPNKKAEIEIQRMKKVTKRTSLCRAEIYNKVSRGEFPLPVKIGRRAIGWRSDEITKWILSRPRAEIKVA